MAAAQIVTNTAVIGHPSVSVMRTPATCTRIANEVAKHAPLKILTSQ